MYPTTSIAKNGGNVRAVARLLRPLTTACNGMSKASRTSDKQVVTDWAVAAWGQAYALAVAKVALHQTVAASEAGAGAGSEAGATQARERVTLVAVLAQHAFINQLHAPTPQAAPC